VIVVLKIALDYDADQAHSLLKFNESIIEFDKMLAIKNRKEARLKKKKRVRKKVQGVAERPRLCVFKSAGHIYAQIIDDSIGRTLASVSSLFKELKPACRGKGGNIEGAKIVGAAIGKIGIEKGISKIVFDRNGYIYHGRVKAFADAARSSRLKFSLV